MRNLTYYVACTVDGFIARENGSFDVFPGEGAHYAYLFAEYPETIPAHFRAQLGIGGENRHFDTVLMGRATYEVGTAIGVTSPYPHLRQLVVSSTMDASPDPAVELVTGDPAGRVRALKQEDGLDIWLCGGGSLAAALYDEIDELVLKVNPVALGAGIPLFRGPERPRALRLTDHRTFAGGVAVHSYRVAREGEAAR